MEQLWRATLDMRTRHEHRQLDGQRVKVGKPFTVDGYEIMFPGDPSAPGYLIYNCRCTVRGVVAGLELQAIKYRDTSAIEGMTYEEWKASKKSESNSITLPEDKGEAIRQAYLAEYRRSGELNNGKKNGNIISGAISGALNPESEEAQKHADTYYGLVRSMKTDISKIAKNTGFSEEDIRKIKNYIFIDEHDFSGEKARFYPNYDMADSWQCLIEGKQVSYDIMLLNHELMEMDLVSKGYTQEKYQVNNSPD